MIKIKICGITNKEDAVLAASMGADFLGFNFYDGSPRKVSEKNCKEIITSLPPFVSCVGLFVNTDIKAAAKISKKCGFKLVQLHGDETPEYCKELKSLANLPLIKAFRVKDVSVLGIIEQYKDACDYILLDAFVDGEPGGTGEVFNWDIAVKAKDFGKPVFLAGGLTPENAAEAIKIVKPFAVDTASGVERLQRRKDYDKLKAFMTASRNA